MISFEEGYQKIAALAEPLGIETIPLEDGLGRILREDIAATRPQPAQDISAMDGYALAGQAQEYHVIGEIAAGAIDPSQLNKGEAARIFTGAPMPKGADRVLIQENAMMDGQKLRAEAPPKKGQHIRPAGNDFNKDYIFKAPKKLTPADIALIAAMNRNALAVSKRAKIAILATGSELLSPGSAAALHHVIASNAYGLRALIEQYGAQADILPIAKDDKEAIISSLSKLAEYDMIVTTGGASIGKYDFVLEAAKAAGFEIKVHKIAMRPGKPVIAGKRGDQILLALPGNPVSAMVTAILFLRPLIEKLSGLNISLPKFQNIKLAHSIGENESRAHFMRARLILKNGEDKIEIFSNQDSALLTLLSSANGLVYRPPFDAAKSEGDRVKFLGFYSETTF